MCLTIPGKVIEIDKDKFVIDYVSEKRAVNFSVVNNLKVGDYVIVSNKIIISRVPSDEAEKYLKNINEIGSENERKL